MQFLKGAAQTRKGLFFLFFLPPVVQGFKDHKRLIPCDLEVLASEILSQTVKVLMRNTEKCETALDTQILTHS